MSDPDRPRSHQRSRRTGQARPAGRQLRQHAGRGGAEGGQRRPHLGRGRPRIRRLPAGLGTDVRRPRPSRGDGGGAGAGAARHHLLRQQPPRHRARRGDLRCRALRRPGALRLLGHRGRSLRHARGPRLPQARQDPEVRRRLSRHERLRADVAGAQAAGQFPAADARFGRHPEVGGRRDAGGGVQRHRHGGKPDRGAEGRARRRHRRAVPAPDPAQARLPAGVARRDPQARHSADLRRGRDRLPLRLWRGAGILRRHARPLQPGQDRGRRLCARRHRRPRRHHEALRPAGHGPTRISSSRSARCRAIRSPPSRAWRRSRS